MTYLESSVLLFLLACAGAQAQTQDTAGAMNPLLDPFAANTKPVSPSLLPIKGPAAPLPAMAPPSPAAPPSALPPGLRALMIRDTGMGLLGAANLDVASIPVSNGKQVRIGNQEYIAEVNSNEIKLYTSLKGRLVWQGTLGGPAQVAAPMDMTQAHFIPPLSAGVNPGLRTNGATSASADATRKNGAP